MVLRKAKPSLPLDSEDEESLIHIVTKPQCEPLITLKRSKTDGFPLLVITMDQVTPFILHQHDFVELVYVKSGSCTHRHGGKTYPIYMGDCFVVLPSEKHTYEAGENLRIVNILFYPEIFGDRWEYLQKTPGFVHFTSTEPLFRGETSFRYKLHIPVAQQEPMVALCDSLESEIQKRQGGYQAMAGGLFLQLIVFLSRCFDRSIHEKDVHREFDGKGRTVAAAMAYLEKNFRQDLRLSDVARSACISPTRLSHVFKSATGISLFDYLTKMRIDQASSLLSQTDQSVTEIAFAVGFHDPAYFTRVFTKTIGASPSAFRKRAA